MMLELIDSFTILTTDANDQLRPLHDRMPVILEPEDVGRWLDPGAGPADELLRPAADGLLEMHAVSPRVNRPEHDDAALLEPVAPLEADGPADRQMELF